MRLSGYSHGTDVWLGNAKDLILSGTATVKDTIGCRDDIMLYLISCGMDPKRSFKIMESVRKGRGLPEGAEQEMLDHGVPEWYIGSCRKIKYLFPKAHAVAYVMMGFRIAYFKVHYPLEFYSAYFYRRSQKDAFDAALMVKGRDFVRRKINEIRSKAEATQKEEELLTTLEAVYEFYCRGFPSRRWISTSATRCISCASATSSCGRPSWPYPASAPPPPKTWWPAAWAGANSSPWRSSLHLLPQSQPGARGAAERTRRPRRHAGREPDDPLLTTLRVEAFACGPPAERGMQGRTSLRPFF